MAVDAGTAYVKVKADLSHDAVSSFSKVAKRALGVFAAAFSIQKVISTALDFTHAAEQAAAAEHLAFGSIQRDMDKTNVKFEELVGWTAKLSETIGQDQGSLEQLAAKVTSSFNLTKLFGAEGAQRGLDKLTLGILNMTAATDKSQTMILKLFQSIANDPKAGIGQLVRLGVVTKTQSEHFKKLADDGKAAAVSQTLLNLTMEHFAGAAKNAATPTEQFTQVWANFKVTLGNFLLPYFSKLLGYLSRVVHWIEQLVGGGKKAGSQFKSFALILKHNFQPIIEFVRATIADIVVVWDKLVKMVQAKVIPTIEKLAAGPFGKLIGAIAKLAGWIIHITLKLLPPLLTVFGGVFSAIGVILNKMATAIVFVINVVIHGINALIRASNLVLRTHFPTIPTIDLSGSTTGYGSRGEGTVQPPRGGSGVAPFAEGGIVTRPTIGLIGEAGPEAIVPLRGGSHGMTVRIVDSNLDLVMTGVLEDDRAFADRAGRSHR